MCSKLYQHDYNLYSYPCSFSATSSVQPRTWQGGRGEQDVYGNPRPFQYMRALRPTDPQIYPNVSNQVQVESPTSYQPRSNIPTNRPMETSLVQPRAHRNNLVAKPRSFDISLRIPFAHSQTKQLTKRHLYLKKWCKRLLPPANVWACLTVREAIKLWTEYFCLHYKFLEKEERMERHLKKKTFPLVITLEGHSILKYYSSSLVLVCQQTASKLISCCTRL